MVHTLDDTGVGVEGDVFAGVAEELLTERRVLFCHEEYCSAGVAEIMEPCGGHMGQIQEWLKVTLFEASMFGSSWF